MTTLTLAQSIIQFKSTHEQPEQITACLDFCASYFDRTDVIVKRYESEGVPSLMIQTEDTLDVDVLLLGHIDTIEGPDRLFEGTVVDGKLYGRGSLDMKAFVATSMQVMKRLIDNGYRGNVALAIVTDEELGGMHGARYLIEDIGYRAKVVLVPDDGEHMQNIVIESKHVLQYRFIATGKESHGCQPWYGKNAILSLMETYRILAAHFEACHAATEECWVNTINLGIISGGIAANEVPAHAEMVVDIRITKDTTAEEVDTWVQSACLPGVVAELSMEGHRTVIDESDPMLRAYVRELEQVTGATVNYIQSGGATDGRYFAAKGMKVIVHQGTGGNCQAEDEYVEVASLDQLVDVQVQFIKNNVS